MRAIAAKDESVRRIAIFLKLKFFVDGGSHHPKKISGW
jgi:hypothetical protein